MISRTSGRHVFNLLSRRGFYAARAPNRCLKSPPLAQHRNIRTKVNSGMMKASGNGPTGGEKILMQRMLEQRQSNISKVAREKDWFFSDHLQPPSGWSYEWPAWVAGWELVPIVTRSHTELVLDHFFGMAGRFTPIMFRLDPFAPDFIFRYEGMNSEDSQRKEFSWIDQGSPGAYYYYRIGDDEVFKFSNKFDSYSPEDFISAAGTTIGSEHLLKETSIVSVLSNEYSARAFAEECDSELIHFEQRVAALENEAKERPDPVMDLVFGNSTEEPLYPITDEKILALREKYESYKSYGAYSVYSLVPDDGALRAEERGRKQSQYLLNVKDFEKRMGELEKELQEITDDEGEFEVVKQERRGRRRKINERFKNVAN